MWSSLRNIPRILQRPKVLMFISVIIIFFLLNRSKYSVIKLKAYANFEGIHRVVSFEKGDEVLELRDRIIRAFSDLHLDRIPPACVKLLKYDESVLDYVHLPFDSPPIEEDIQVSCGITGESGIFLSQGPHPIEPNTPYRLWNLATASLLKREPNNVVSCNGSFKDMDYNTVVKTMGAGKNRKFAFIFEDNVKSKTYVLNATNPLNIAAVEVPHPRSRDFDTSMRFRPSYYWGFTVLRNMQYNTLYLGCLNGRSLLVPMNNLSYPDPQALFITNGYVLTDLAENAETLY